VAGKPFRAWLYTLAHNALVDHQRRTRPVMSLDNPEHPIDCPSDGAARELVQWMDTELLARAVRQLTPEQQQVIVLRFVEGQDTAEIAAIMGKREGTIRALQFRALQSLRRILGQQDEGPHDHD
jgi:RNA polymerase sigma-70 factor (ECF subfamily)